MIVSPYFKHIDGFIIPAKTDVSVVASRRRPVWLLLSSHSRRRRATGAEVVVGLVSKAVRFRSPLAFSASRLTRVSPSGS